MKFKLVLVIKTALSADSNHVLSTLKVETLLVVPEAEINANHALITSMIFMFLILLVLNRS